MATGKEIRNQIKSIKNTQKITRAMQMVAASKMRKAQQQMRTSRPYAEKIRNVLCHVHQAHPEYHHPFLEEREVKRIGFIMITSDRGLCGGLNTNAIKAAVSAMKEWHDKKVEIEVCAIGNKGLAFMQRMGADVVSQTSGLGDRPRIEDLIGTVKVMLDAYGEGRLDRIALVYNKFINTMTQRPMVEQLLPCGGRVEEGLGHHWDYIYDPDAKDVLDELLTRYLEAQVFHGVVENLASEQSARMVARIHAG